MAEHLVASNTSPLISLAGVNLLDLLPQVYGKILVAEAVFQEYAVQAPSNDPLLSRPHWLYVMPVDLTAPLAVLPGFGVGEASTILLAQAYQARLVILDDKRARKTAIQQGLKVVGTLGVLVRAHRMGFLSRVRPVLDKMITQGRYISPDLRQQVLQQVGEDDHP